MANNKTFLAFSCVHLPHHDVAGVDWLIAQIAERQPDVVVCLGDMFDAESISSFAKSNVVALKNEYEVANEFCERVNDASPKSKRVWMRGNHEDRMFREEHKHLTGILDYRQWVKAAKSWHHYDYIYSPDHTYTLGPVTFAHGWVTGEAACKREAIELGVANGLYVHGHCFSEDTELLTMKGWKKHSEVHEGDLVATMNKKTRAFEWNVANGVYKWDHYKSLYHLKGNGFDLMVTDKHGMCYEKQPTGEYAECEAQDFAGMSHINMFNACPGGASAGWGRWDRPTLALLIQLVADGCVEQCGIRWHLLKPRKIERLAKLLDTLRIPYSLNEAQDGKVKIYVSRKNMPSNVMDVVGSVKELPWELASLSDWQCREAIEEYRQTDGTALKPDDEAFQLYSKSERNIDVLQAMCIRAGYRAKKVMDKGYGRLNVTRRATSYSVKTTATEVPYEGTVWCVNVDNGTLIVRRNGIPTVTLNTHRPHRPHRIKLGQVRVPFHHANAGCFIAQKPGYMKTKNDSQWGAGVVVGHTPTKRRYEGSCKWRADTLLYKMHWDEIEPTWQGVAA